MSAGDARLAAPAPTEVPDFTALYRAQLNYVWNSLRRLGVADRDLEDACHEVFLVVHRRLGDYDPARPLRPWLFGIALRVASQFRRGAARRPALPGDAQLPADASGPSPEATMMRHQTLQLMHAALAHVDEDARAVFILHDLDEVSVPDAATALGIPLNTAYTRLRRARLAVNALVQAALAIGRDA